MWPSLDSVPRGNRIKSTISPQKSARTHGPARHTGFARWRGDSPAASPQQLEPRLSCAGSASGLESRGRQDLSCPRSLHARLRPAPVLAREPRGVPVGACPRVPSPSRPSPRPPGAGVPPGATLGGQAPPPPRLTRGRLPVSSSMAPLANFMALCSGFTVPSPAAAAMAPGGGGGGGSRGAGLAAGSPERSRRGCGSRPSSGPPEGTRPHFRRRAPSARTSGPTGVSGGGGRARAGCRDGAGPLRRLEMGLARKAPHGVAMGV